MVIFIIDSMVPESYLLRQVKKDLLTKSLFSWFTTIRTGNLVIDEPAALERAAAEAGVRVADLSVERRVPDTCSSSADAGVTR